MNDLPIVFYIDDDQDDLFLFENAMDELQADAVLFSDSEDLLVQLHNPPPRPSLVFVDLNMPKKSGFDIIEEMKASKNLKDIPVIILSTAGDVNNIERCRRAGASYYIQKPTNMSLLKKAVATALNIDWSAYDIESKGFIHHH